MSERYFFITYHAQRNRTDGAYTIGNINFPYEGFPPKKEIDSFIKTFTEDHNSVVITGIFEFNSKEDYESFVKP